MWCVMLASCGRWQMQDRARKCFENQTYTNKRLRIYCEYEWDPISYTVGNHRNAANKKTPEDCIIAHWDDDDWSHPNRLAEQVALLQSSGAEAVGYHDMVFWDTTPLQSQAWLYQHGGDRYALGTSLMYWRKTWDRVKFPDTSKGEDTLWLREVKCKSVSSVDKLDVIVNVTLHHNPPKVWPYAEGHGPRMIAEIHGSNTSSRIHRDSDQFTRIPELDSYCMERMKL